MKRIAFGLIVLLLTATVLTTALITNFSNPFASSKSDYSADFAKTIGSTGWTPINPISQTADNVYSGSYRASSGNSSENRSFNLTVTIEIAQSAAAAQERYGQLVFQKQSDGYTSGNSQLGNSTIFGDTSASWFGYTNSLVSATTNATTNASSSVSTYTLLYAYDKEINNWVVVTETTDTIGQNLS
ncbi:MAG: hypothetical protein ABSD89_12075 [Halobacteriota archaeon]|jgi:hypothetical protein